MSDKTVKMKGSEIIALIQKAKKAVDVKAGTLGEIGAYLRGLGYHINTDGFSVCNFRELTRDICYTATCYDRDGWKFYNAANFGKKWDDWMKVENIDPEAEYEVAVKTSVAKRFAAGEIDAKTFVVEEQGGGSTGNKRYFDSFEKADEYARTVAQQKIESTEKDRDLRRYTASRVVDYEQLANERSELRHYQWYNYQGHTCWVSVSIEGKW